jgi:hypothetical protein
MASWILNIRSSYHPTLPGSETFPSSTLTGKNWPVPFFFSNIDKREMEIKLGGRQK